MLVTSLSLFERLPRVLFIAICHYLPLEHKLSKLLTLNHLINKSFVPLACCRYDTVKLVLNRFDFQPRYAVINYMNVVRSIHIDAEGSVNSTVLTAIKHAVKSQLLESLHINQRTVETQRNLGMVVLDVLASLDPSRPSRLKRLSLEIHDDYDRAGMNWSGLKRCTELQSLSLALADGPYLGMQMQGLTELFPSSLTHLRVLSTATNSELRYDVWKAALASSDFLPHLQRLDLVNSSGFNKAQLDVLSSTVMRTTGTIRPMRAIKVFATEALPDVSAFDHLTSISLRIQPKVIPLIAELPQAMLAQLTAFNVELAVSPEDRTDTELDFSPLLIALHSPNIRDARITLNMAEGGIVQPLSHEALRAMYSMKSLEHLEIVPFALDASTFVAPTLQCWPQLRSLKLALKNCPNACFDRLLEAAPSVALAKVELLNEASVFNQLTCVTFISAVALLGVHCKRAKAIDVIMPEEDSCPIVTRDHILNSQVGEYLADASFKDLMSLNIRSNHLLIEDHALHVLLKKLSKSSKLTQCAIGQNMSKAQQCMLRALPHLSYLPYVSDDSLYFALNRPKPSVNFDVEVETDSDGDYDDEEMYYDTESRSESENEQQENEDEYLYLEDALRYSRSPFTPEDFSGESVLAKLGSSPSLRFSRATRERWIESKKQSYPLDGRQAFFESLFDSLSVKDRATLCQFDQITYVPMHAA